VTWLYPPQLPKTKIFSQGESFKRKIVSPARKLFFSAIIVADFVVVDLTKRPFETFLEKSEISKAWHIMQFFLYFLRQFQKKF
jgi:hypothetical protein